MENRKAYIKALTHILCCIIILLIFVITTTRVNAMSCEPKELNGNITLKPLIKESIYKFDSIETNEINNIKYDSPRVIENNIYIFIDKYIDTIKFFSNMFGFDVEFIKDDLIQRNLNNTVLNENNLGGLKNSNDELMDFPNVEYGISEYFFELSNLYPEKKENKIISYTGDSDYIEKLIIYYTNIYEEVDTTLALSIGAAESGYYKVKYMLQKNNVYGGMGTNGLIVYDNIEIGVLKYIRLLSKSYFKKGLTTKETIGRKYCPQINSNGEKVASAHWINLVTKAENKYSSYTKDITIEDIIVK